MLIAIDPGTTHSAIVIMDGKHVVDFAKLPNQEVVNRMPAESAKACAIEMIASYGMPVGAEVFETCIWIGRFMENLERLNIPTQRITRSQVKQSLCHRTAGVNDSVIRQRCIDIYGGKAAAIGNKAKPGPLYGIKADCWAALALGLAWHDLSAASAARGTP